MIHPRVRQLADNLVSHSIGLKPGEKILIEEMCIRDSICSHHNFILNIPFTFID